MVSLMVLSFSLLHELNTFWFTFCVYFSLIFQKFHEGFIRISGSCCTQTRCYSRHVNPQRICFSVGINRSITHENKACFPPMRLNILMRINIILLVGTLWIISKKLISQFPMRLLVCSHKNNIKTFWYYSHNNSVIFEFDNAGMNRCDCRNVKILIRILL